MSATRATRAGSLGFAGRHMGAFALLERNPPIDDGIANALGLLDQATLPSREVGSIHRAVILKPQLRLLVNDDVGSETLAQDSPIGEASDPGRQATDLVVGLFQAHDLPVRDV